MSNQTALEPSSPSNTRGIIAFPAIDDFYNELMDRLHMVVDQFYLEEKFTIFINALPRDHTEGTKIFVDRFAFEKLELVYGGISRQRQFLEKESIKELNSSWKQLENAKLFITNSKISIMLSDEFREGDYTLSDIEDIGIGKLSDYFAPILSPALGLDPLTEEQEAEYEILNQHFDILSYRYLSLPLIQFAEFDGVVHIILSEADYQNNFIGKDQKLNTRVVGNVIKAFSREYEGLILDWDIVGYAKLKEESFVDAVDKDELYRYNNQDNPILKELGYREYYEKHRTYFEDRFRYNQQVPLNIRQQYRQIAIIHILIDSYAHNISAHSLTALEWWFRQRAEMVSSKARGEQVVLPTNGQGENLVALLRYYEMQLDKEIHPLLRFLLDKGAFWTGLTRDNSFGGRIMNLHNVLWRDFITNPLYLGTIAYTEGIVKLHIHITFLKYESQEKSIRVKKKVELDGHYVTIDLKEFHPNQDSKNMDQHTSDFVVKGEDFDLIKERLVAYKAFFPGGVVGEHAFFTILETELRNVKHYKPEELEQIRKEGLTLNISVEEDNYRVDKAKIKSEETQYYKIGVWLKHPLEISKELMMLRPQKLYDDIVEKETFLPKLGGTYQDKVCAAMLFNNTFASVENQESERDERFYPWLKAGSSPTLEYKTGTEIEDIELSARRLLGEDEKFNDSKQYFKDHIKPHYGYFKKFFHIWKGENIFDIEQLKVNMAFENISRFRFIYAPSENHDLTRKVRESGIIRIINEKTTEVYQAYHQWLKKWLKFDNEPMEYRVEFSRESKVAAQVDLKESKIIFFNKSQLEKETLSNLKEINLIHNPNQYDDKKNAAIRYRNHGIFKEYFCGRKELEEAEMSSEVAAELLEAVGTRICVFDNRIAARFKEINTDILKDQLNCTVYEERQNHWIAEKEKGFFKHNFLVVHLSFVETLKNKKGEKYNENDIRDFIDEQILDGGTIPENFILVITTGRGRTHWWEKLKNVYVNKKPDENIPPYTTFVTFRPVESLMASIENAITMKDDMELKYRLVKVLFGS